jgi:membrane protease YdiL (CAAX protease family)
MFAIAIAAALVVRNTLLRYTAPILGADWHDLSRRPSSFLLLREGSIAMLILVATFTMAKIERRSLWSYGLSGTREFRNVTMGFISGIVFFSLLVELLVLDNNLAFDGWALHGAAIIGYALFWIVFDFMVGFSEEILFRGYFLQTLARGIGFWPAAICCSVAFGLAHLSNSGEDFIGIAAIILGGILFSLFLKVTGSLWWGIGFHAALAWVQDFLFGTANSGQAAPPGHLLSSHPLGDVRLSGGADGPEGSLIAVILVLVLVALIAAATTLKRRSSEANSI